MSDAVVTKRVKRALLGVVRAGWMLVAFLGLWELFFQLRPSLVTPPMSKILSSMFDEWFSASPTDLFLGPHFYDHAIPSLLRLGAGWSIAVLVGVTLGIALGSSRFLENFFKPIVRFGVCTPTTVMLPLVIVIFGFTDRTTIVLIAMGTMWVILLNTMDGVKAISLSYRDAARSMMLPRRLVFFRVVLPAAGPQIFAGLRVSLGIGLILMVISEIFVSTNGVGFTIAYSQRLFDFGQMWSAVAFVGVLGIAFNGLFMALEKRLLGWHLRSQRNG